jgi:hypothetical protein
MWFATDYDPRPPVDGLPDEPNDLGKGIGIDW